MTIDRIVSPGTELIIWNICTLPELSSAEWQSVVPQRSLVPVRPEFRPPRGTSYL